ncbi:hypothetical protein DdX_19641 [Ditylenchus destructor]|uniref:Uncharacterized protein n=1 Tax=Ditylenchus destructor TaxID=166010 RepID=A0AAD4MK28_9BILA|nr:hypothetical protein DdX_19641 [Ditylenchus destructor]
MQCAGESEGMSCESGLRFTPDVNQRVNHLLQGLRASWQRQGLLGQELTVHSQSMPQFGNKMKERESFGAEKCSVVIHR